MRQHNDSDSKKRPRIPLWLRIPFSLAFIVVLVAGFLFFIQHSMIYYPRAYSAEYDGIIGSNVHELNYEIIGSGKQTAFYFSPKENAGIPSHIWVMFSGNASVALDWLYLLERPGFRDHGFLLVDYPGYGKSEGKAGMVNTRASAEKALEKLGEHLQVKQSDMEPRLNAAGQSLGAAAALDFAARHQVGRVLLIAPFTSMRDIAATVVGRPFSYLVVENYDNRERLQELSQRTLPPRVAIFHGVRDEVIPFRMGQELAGAHPTMIVFRPIERAGHNDIVGIADEEIIRWMNE